MSGFSTTKSKPNPKMDGQPEVKKETKKEKPSE